MDFPRYLDCADGRLYGSGKPMGREKGMDSLVTTEWLAGELGAADLKIVDATYVGADGGRDPAAEFEAGHIPGAVFMDLENLVDGTSELPSMLPPPEKFASRMQAAGLGDGSRIVVYDASPWKTAARAWWMLRVFGAADVAILDGGLEKWKAEGRPLETGKPRQRHRHFTVWFDSGAVRDKAQIAALVASGDAQIVDARSSSRFTGEEPETRAGLASGHIPGSRNLPYTRLLNADGTYKAADAIKAEFDAAGVALDKPLVTSCGSGITASVLAFGAKLAGAGDVALYDGSWTDWGSDPATPKASGEA